MKSENLLFSLIKSLSPSEKRYFKVFVGGIEKAASNKYVELFDAIVKQSVYEEGKLVKQLAFEHNHNGFAVAKNYLYNLILKSLRNYNNNKSPEMEFSDLITDIGILYRKGLFENAAKSLKKAKNIALKTERQELIFAACGWELKLIEHLCDPPDFKKRYEGILASRKKIAGSCMRDFVYYEESKNMYFNNLYGKVLKEGDPENERLKVLLAKESEETDSVREKLNLLAFKYEYYEAQRIAEKSYEVCKSRLAMFDKHPYFKLFMLQDYLTSIHNYLRCHLDLFLFEEFEKDFHLLLDFHVPRYNQTIQIKKEQGIMNLLCSYYVYTGQLDKINRKYRPEIDKMLKDPESFLLTKEGINTVGMLCKALCGLEKYEEALQYYFPLSQFMDRNVYPKQYVRFHLIGFFIHFGLGNYRLIDSLYRSIQNYADQRIKNDPFLDAILRLLKQMVENKTNQKALMNAFAIIKTEIEAMDSEYLSRSIVFAPTFIQWVNSLVSGKPVEYFLKNRSIYQSVKISEKLSIAGT